MSTRCSYCHDWDAEHNRIGCPTRKEDVADMRKRHEAGDCEYYPSLLSQDDNYKKKKVRKCSYCYNRHGVAEYNHTRRNCPRLKEDREKMAVTNREWRGVALAFLKDRGIGPGAIIRDKHNGLGVISYVDWGNMTCLLRAGQMPSYQVFGITFFKTEREKMFNFINHEGSRSYYNWEGPEEILVPASERIIDANIPDGWLDGNTGLDFYFNIKQDPRY